MKFKPMFTLAIFFLCVASAASAEQQYSCSGTCVELCAAGNIPCIIACSDYQDRCCENGQDICVPVDPPEPERDDFSCESSCDEVCPSGDLSCMISCNLYQDECCEEGQDVCGEGTGCSLNNLRACSDEQSCRDAGGYWYSQTCYEVAQSVPDSPVTDIVTDLHNSPITVEAGEDGTSLNMSFDYGDNEMYLIAGIMDPDFTETFFLNQSCDFGGIGLILEGEGAINCDVSLPPEGFDAENLTGTIIFWMISAENMLSPGFDWQNGHYELLFFTISDLESCIEQCNPGDIACIIECNIS